MAVTELRRNSKTFVKRNDNQIIARPVIKPSPKSCLAPTPQTPMSALRFLWLSHRRFSLLYCLHHTPTQYTFGVRPGFDEQIVPKLSASLYWCSMWRCMSDLFNIFLLANPCIQHWQNVFTIYCSKRLSKNEWKKFISGFKICHRMRRVILRWDF